MPVTIHPRKTLVVLATITILLTLAYLATLALMYGAGHDYVFGMVELFDVDGEQNVPALYSFCLLAVAAALLVSIAGSRRRAALPHARRWAVLAAVFAFLSFDEAVSIHERISLSTASATGAAGLEYYAWLLPYGIAGVVFVIAYIPFVRDLPAATRKRFVVAGLLYGLGAFGSEFLAGAYVHAHHTEQTLGYDLIAGLEEFLEMAGSVWFVYALLRYIESELGGMVVRAGK